ncbi:transposase (plasmid) [Nonomuraea sp. CA-143628]|uniref:transposase n=1 Tax=Nonomuraea sp. CA-143628 TaxID=3239997 RepID=UPI003D9215A3
MAIWRGPDGILVETIVLDRRPCLRVSQVVNGRRYHQAYCGLAELAQYVDLADLVEVILFPRVPA